jgi:hypothetical protein
MADRKPPRVVSGELGTLLALLQYQRDSLVRKVSGVTEADARRKLVGSDTTLLWLVKHLARAESTWVERRFAGLDVELPAEAVGPDDTLGPAVDAYRQVWARTDQIILDAPDLDQFCRDTGAESPVTLRWVLAHLLDETSRHAGHADILRELIDGSTGR